MVALLFRDLSSLTWDWIEPKSCEIEFLCLNHWIATELPAFLPEDWFMSSWEWNQRPGTQHLFLLLYLVLYGILVTRMRTEGMWVCVCVCVCVCVWYATVYICRHVFQMHIYIIYIYIYMYFYTYKYNILLITLTPIQHNEIYSRFLSSDIFNSFC